MEAMQFSKQVQNSERFGNSSPAQRSPFGQAFWQSERLKKCDERAQTEATQTTHGLVSAALSSCIYGREAYVDELAIDRVHNSVWVAKADSSDSPRAASNLEVSLDHTVTVSGYKGGGHLGPYEHWLAHVYTHAPIC